MTLWRGEFDDIKMFGEDFDSHGDVKLCECDFGDVCEGDFGDVCEGDLGIVCEGDLGDVCEGELGDGCWNDTREV